MTITSKYKEIPDENHHTKVPRIDLHRICVVNRGKIINNTQFNELVRERAREIRNSRKDEKLSLKVWQKEAERVLMEEALRFGNGSIYIDVK